MCSCGIVGVDSFVLTAVDSSSKPDEHCPVSFAGARTLPGTTAAAKQSTTLHNATAIAAAASSSSITDVRQHYHQTTAISATPAILANSTGTGKQQQPSKQERGSNDDVNSRETGSSSYLSRRSGRGSSMQGASAAVATATAALLAVPAAGATVPLNQATAATWIAVAAPSTVAPGTAVEYITN